MCPTPSSCAAPATRTLRRRAAAFEAQFPSKTMPCPRGAPSSGAVPSNGAFQSSGYSGAFPSSWYSGAIPFNGSFPSGCAFPLGAGFHSGSSSSTGGSVQAGMYSYGGSANGRGSGSPISFPATAAPCLSIAFFRCKLLGIWDYRLTC